MAARRTKWTLRGMLYWFRLPRFRHAFSGDTGMSTVEYAIGSIAAAALAAVLYAVVTGDSVSSGIETLIQRALSGPL